MINLLRQTLWLAGLLGLGLAGATSAGAQDWSHYGAGPSGLRYSSAAEITPANVERLRLAWSFHTGDARRGAVSQDTALEVTPILAEGRLVLCSPFNEVIALDPGSGRVLWRHDPRVRTNLRPGNHYVCRGVAYWRDPQAAASAPCAARVLSGLTDGRLIALDLATGRPCAGFGAAGEVQTFEARPRLWPGEAQITSPPVVVQERVVVGSSISDNWRVGAPSGAVHAFDVRTGAPAWAFDPGPKGAGAANVWAPMSVDPVRGWLFLPTTSPSPDFFGGARADSPDANAVVALDGRTGRKIWSFQTVHHDIWDYDLPAQPSLVTLTIAGRRRDAVVQVTKTGFVFVLDRDTGAPIFPVVERPVPQGGVPGEHLAATQPIPSRPPALVPQTLTPQMAWGLTPWDKAACRKMIEASRSEGLFTPESTKGTILYPFTGGGANWGGAAFDPATQTLYVNTSRVAQRVTLIPAKAYASTLAAASKKVEVRPQAGTPWAEKRELLVSPLGLPCTPPPWGMLTAVDLGRGTIRWQSVLGTVRDLAPVPLPLKLGTPNLGGPAATGGGVVFIGAAMDRYLRAFDSHSGRELWKARLPAGGQATPMTYVWRGRQYVVIAAGGSTRLGGKLGDAILAYRLP